MIMFLSVLILLFISIVSVEATDDNNTIIQDDSTNTIQNNNIKDLENPIEKNKNLKKEENPTSISDYDQLYESLNTYQKDDVNLNLEGNDTYIIDKQISINERIKNININGNNKTFKSLNTSFMKIGSNTAITISNITVIGCNQTSGSVFNNRGNLTIINSSFINNTAKSEGGAIYNSKNLNVINCTFINNTALKGGVINSHKNLTVTNSIFENSSATNGGVFYIYGTTSSNITNNTINNSNARFAGVVFCYGMGNILIQSNNINNTYASMYGGVVLNHGLESVIVEENIIENSHSQWGSVCVTLDNITIRKNTFNNNSADFGGVLFNWADMTIEDNIFSNNKAEIGSCIYNSADSTANITRNEFINNSAEDGGVIYNSGKSIINDNTFTNNYVTDTNGYVIKSDEDLINEDSEHMLYITNNQFIKNSDYTRDMLLNYDRIDAIYNNTYIGNYLATSITNLDDMNSTDKLECNITINLDEKYNTTINEGNIEIYINNNYIKDIKVEDNNPLISLNGKELETNNNIDLIYTSDDNSFQRSSISFKANIYKNTQLNMTINNPEYNSILEVNTTITDLDENPVTEGYIIYKINGLTLKEDNQTIKTEIKNSTATLNYQLPENYNCKEYTIEVVYSGSKNYNYTRNTATFNITKVNTTLTVATDKNSCKMDESITITAKINTDKNINYGVMIFKINKITIKDENNQTIQVPIKNGTAQITFRIPDGWSAKEVNITAVYAYKNYERIENYTYINITPTTPTFNIINSSITENTLNISTILTDEYNHTLKGSNTIIVKINSLTIKDKTNMTQYFTSTDGVVDINIELNYNLKKGSYIIELVTGKRNAYDATRKQFNMTV